MRYRIKKIVAYIFRGWDNEPAPPHPRLRILPPFFFEVIAYLIGLAILYQIGVYLWSII